MPPKSKILNVGPPLGTPQKAFKLDKYERELHQHWANTVVEMLLQDKKLLGKLYAALKQYESEV